MDSWKIVFHRGVVPNIPRGGLEALRIALAAQDAAATLQDAATQPPAWPANAERPLERCCPLNFALWRGLGLSTVGECEEAFADLCRQVEAALGEPAAIRYFFSFWDGDDLAAVLPQLLIEVTLALDGSHAGAA